MNQFNNLPPELIEFIFKKVNFNDLINLRIADKRFKEICEQIKIKQLCLYTKEKNDFSSSKFWFYTNDPTLITNDLIKMSKLLNYRSFFKLDKYLKRLSICLGTYEDFNISILNEFKSLEQLQINGLHLNHNYKLSLKNLKIVCISPVCYGEKLTLDTNQLFAFNSLFRNLDRFVFNYPDKILFYETNYYHYDDSRIFNNLKYLKLIHVDGSIDKDILSKFKYLKVLDLDIYKFIKRNDYEDLVEDIISILNEKKNLKRSELQIYLNGVKLIDQNKLNQFKWSANKNKIKYNQLKFRLKNYDLLKDNCCYMVEIDYCDLIKLIKIIPLSFTNKFPFIHKVKANDHIDNEDQFFKFLSNLNYLTKLDTINCRLTKSFYDQLINLVYLNNLVHLGIYEKKDLGLNFDFIFNSEQLEEFETNQIMDNRFVLIYKLFEKDKCLKKFLFKFDLKIISK